MNVTIWQTLVREDSAQDLVEYALVAALIALGAVAAMNGVAGGISNTFSAVSSDLSSALLRRH